MQKKLKLSYVLFFLFGAALMLGVRTLRGSNAQQFEHVYELPIYHVHEGKADALRDRFGNYTDALFKRHNMKSIGYWVPEDAPDHKNSLSTFSSSPAGRKPRKTGLP